MQPSKEDEQPTTPSQLAKSLLKTAYIIHFIISCVLTTYILVKFPEVVSATVTFVMLILFGYMGVWVLLIGFLLVVQILSFSCVEITWKQLYSAAFLLS